MHMKRTWNTNVLRPTPAVRRFAFNALLLIGVNLFMRTVGVSFNAYLAGQAGAEVMGLYSLLFGVYGLAMTLGSAGINLGTTRLVAEVMGTSCPAKAGEGDAACRRAILCVMRRCLTYSLVCSIATAILLFLSAPFVGKVWLGDVRTILSLRVLALTLPPIAVSACFGGYFTAVRRIAKSAAVGIGVQFIRIGACAYLLRLWLPAGVEMTCLSLVLGGALSEFCGLFLTVIAYLWDRRRHLTVGLSTSDRQVLAKADIPCAALVAGRAADASVDNEATGQRNKTLMRRLLDITVPVTLAACLRSGLLTLQHILIPRGLKKSGASWVSALSSYGVLHSMVLPVVLFPSAFISSFSGLLVPEVAESCARGDRARVARLAERIITPALIFSFGVAGIMAAFGHELGEAIYGAGNREAGIYIRILAPLIPIMYVDSSVDAFLKGMGEQVYSMNVNIIDALASVILVWLLLPRMGLAGYIVAIFVTETLNTTLSLCRMLRLSRMPVRLYRQVFGPLLCVLGATCLCRLGGLVFRRSVTDTLSLILHMAICAGLYGLLLVLTGVVRLPKGDRRPAR